MFTRLRDSMFSHLLVKLEKFSSRNPSWPRCVATGRFPQTEGPQNWTIKRGDDIPDASLKR
jgi:hypothetical protein